MPKLDNINITINHVESFLTKQNSFNLLDWLIDTSLLPYTNYEQWRQGSSRFLQDSIQLSEVELKELVTTVDKFCKALKLEAEIQEYFGWSNENTGQAQLKISGTAAIENALRKKWIRAQDVPQLDLFMDNTAQLAENAIYDRLSNRDFSAANQHLAILSGANSKHPKLGAFRDLILYGQHLESNPLANTDSITEEFIGLDTEVGPLAREVLGSYSRDYLAFAWHRLATSLTHHNCRYNSSLADGNLHPSYCLIQIPDWQSAHANLLDTQEFYRHPMLLLNFAKCCEQLNYENAALLSWCHLFDIDQDFAENLAETKLSNLIWPLWNAYWESYEEAPVEFFPAYLVLGIKQLAQYAKSEKAFPSFAMQD